MLCPHVLLLIHMCFSQGYHASYMCPDVILLISTVHVHTMRNSCPLTSSLTLTSSRLFLILLDPKSFQTILASIIWLPGHVLSICCRLIITNYLYLANPNPSQSLFTHLSYNTYASPTHPEIISPWWYHLQIIQACLPWQPPFSQHVLWQCCNHLGIPSSTAEILLFNSVFYDGVTPVSVSTLKPLLGVIGVLPLKPQVSPILSVCI